MSFNFKHKAIIDITSAINEIDKSLIKDKDENTGQLEMFKLNLDTTKKHLENGHSVAFDMPGIKRMSHIISDSWDHDNKLGTVILRAKHSITKCLNNEQ
tara:strand:- start:151 stop:447 length:297 start_codon:yes stop_codon:yes gene_type:complete